MKTTAQRRRASVPALAISVLLAACAAAFDEPLAHAGGNDPWPPAWQDAPAPTEFMPPAFDPPSASHCHRAPTTREVPGGGVEQQGLAPHKGAMADARRESSGVAAERSAKSPALAAPATDSAHFPPAPWPQPQPVPQRPARETVTAGMVDDNADFGEYLAYRQRHAGLPVRERDISERYLLEVTDASGHPVHDAEVAVQRAGVAQPVMWARTDTAGRVWLHPRAFLSPSWAGERVLGVAVRKGAMQSRALLRRGQAQAVQVRLADDAASARPRLDLVFLVDATGSMGDEIAKLKASMHAVAQQISQLPGQPDTCYGLVAYRDRGDAFLTRSHDFTDDLGAFQQQLARVHAAGGGDMPEALNEALHEVVHGLSWRRDAARLVVLVADAPPHLDYGGPQYDTDMQAALAKGIKLFAVGASGLDPVGEYIYRQIAQYTAGRFVFLTYRDAANPGSGPGTQTVHDVKQYSVQTLDRLIVRLVGEEMARLRRG
jgi:Mg-chelatase subunit ChlD